MEVAYLSEVPEGVFLKADRKDDCFPGGDRGEQLRNQGTQCRLDLIQRNVDLVHKLEDLKQTHRKSTPLYTRDSENCTPRVL